MRETRSDAEFRAIAARLASAPSPAAADAAIAGFLEGLDPEAARAAVERLTHMLLDGSSDPQAASPERARAG